MTYFGHSTRSAVYYQTGSLLTGTRVLSRCCLLVLKILLTYELLAETSVGAIVLCSGLPVLQASCIYILTRSLVTHLLQHFSTEIKCKK
jgi:hypothetical protein